MLEVNYKTLSDIIDVRSFKDHKEFNDWIIRQSKIEDVTIVKVEEEEEETE